MLKNEIIIINTSMPLRKYMKRRPTHYAELLSFSNRVINISSAPLKERYAYNEPVSWEEIIFFRFPGTRYTIVRKVNNLLYKRFVKRFFNGLGKKPIIWHFYSGDQELYKDIEAKCVILEICDDTPEFFARDPKKYNQVKKNEDELMKRADVVFTISDYLKQKKEGTSFDIKVVRNGVAVEDFISVPNLEKKSSDELFHVKTPIIGYAGAISHWFDFDLVVGLAINHSNFSFVYLGRISDDNKPVIKKLERYENIHFLGEKVYADLPQYLKYFDIGIIPFKIDELTNSVNPIKLYEYLAAGIPTISTPLPEVKLYKTGGLIETPESLEAWNDSIKGILNSSSRQSIVKRCQSLAKHNSWHSRVEEASGYIETVL